MPTAVALDSALVDLQTYGCQMNEYDSELARTILGREGFRFVAPDEATDAAGVVLINTCAIRETAHTKIYARLGDLKVRKRAQKDLVVGLLGCMAQNLKTELLERWPSVDFVCGPDAYRHLPHLIAEARSTNRAQHASIELSEYETYEDIAPTRVEGVNAWIAIMRGCNNFCTFCVVPYTRGRERSRDPLGVVEETRRLAADGHKQVTLLGQNVNSYRHDGRDFADLIEMVADVDGIERVRFTSPHPKDFPLKLLRVIAEHPNVCNTIHLPLQSGNDRILKAMNRGYTQEEFLDLAALMRASIPGLTLTTDIICGFPTETDADYEDTVHVVREAAFESAYIFKYSERQGTTAERKFPDDVPDDVKSRRVTELLAVQREIARAKNVAKIGSVERVLIEGASKKDPGQWRARNDGNFIVVFRDPSCAVGDVRDVRIVEATPNTLIGEPVPA